MAEDEQQVLVTSPKKKVHKLSGKLVRQFSGDVNALITDDEEDEEYVEEIVEEDTEEDSVEEIISSSEEEDDDDEEQDSDDDDVELESIEDDETTGMIDDGTDESGSEFDPLPPPIHIPDALKPPHLRAKEKPQSYYDDYDDDSSIDDDDDSSDDDSSAGGFAKRKKKPVVAKKPAAPAPKKSTFSYDDDDDDVDFSSDSDDTASSSEHFTKKNTKSAVTAVTGKINKDADDYDEDSSEEEDVKKVDRDQPATVEETPTEPEKKIEREEAAQQAGKIGDDPSTSIRPSSYRGNSYVSSSGELPETEKRGGKKPSKWRQEPGSIYEQNGVSSVKASNFSKPSAPEPKPVSENRPNEAVGQSDLRGASAVKNEPIKKAETAPPPEKEKPAVKRLPIVKKVEKEEKVEEDWNKEPKDDGNGPYYSYDELKGKKIPDLDYLNREKYLSPYDFMATFKVKKSEFETWPKWKQTKAKRKVKLF